MSSYYIKALLLQDCYYSDSVHKLLLKNNIPNQIIKVSVNNKELYKTSNINTFPQLYLNKYNRKDNLLLGGYDDLNEFIKMFKNVELNQNNINKFMKNYNWSKKATLRLIELIN